ncbi:hypothetical protein OS493_022020 [Desmophyllum pertusum]|uniref:Uncharacterized protein n=1 Tax=Desmophyllum pertusum TaxID=174260 RepID=A0A9X0CQ48_9CNID|nr:hypothetical protein OS493_022020 [Desmophyllum pertusum]
MGKAVPSRLREGSLGSIPRPRRRGSSMEGRDVSSQELARSVGMAPADIDGDGGGGGGDDDDGGGGGDDDGGGNGGGGDDDDGRDDDGGGDDGGDDDDDVSVPSENIWFYRPFRYPGNKFHEGNGSLPTENSDADEACNGRPCISDDLQSFQSADDSSQLFLGDLHYIDHNEDTPPAAGRHKHNPRVTIPGREGEHIYKSTLVSMLNQDPNLSHDRLQRVRQRQEYGRAGSETTLQSNHVALFEGYAVLDRNNKTFKIGNLAPPRLICAGTRNVPMEYQRPVPYNDPKKQSITTYMQLYNPVQGPDGVEQRGVYELKTSELCTFPFVDVLTRVQYVSRRKQPL